MWLTVTLTLAAVKKMWQEWQAHPKKRFNSQLRVVIATGTTH